MAEQEWSGAAFPKLDEAQLASLESWPQMQLRTFRKGGNLFEADQRNCKRYCQELTGRQKDGNKRGQAH